ncbi:MAG: nitrite reductase large subunit NirB [Myxococcales bacterium]|nr:nitrite reductase large subunit NirB [Myxococcales bacterium]
MRRKLVLIGNGMAGARFLEEIVARDPGAFDITVFGEEPYGNYDRIALSHVLGGEKRPEEIFLNPLAWYEANGIHLLAGARVREIDRAARRVVGEDGTEALYDDLVLATGSAPFVPPIAGADKPGVFVFRTLHDCERIAERARAGRRAVVIGGGLLGLEAARGLLGHGVSVTVVHLMPHLMEVQLDAPAGASLRRTIEGLGIDVVLGASTESIVGADGVEGVRLQGGRELPADLVVIACGIRPRVELGREAGFEVGRGIRVDDALGTSDPHVHALGECVEHRGRTYGLVAPLYEQAAVLADRLVARAQERPCDAAYAGSEVSTQLKVMGVDLVAMGDSLAEADETLGREVLRYEEPARGLYRKVVIEGGRVRGAILLGDVTDAARLRSLLRGGAPAPERRSEILFPSAGVPTPHAADLPDDAQICDCNGVTKGGIREGIRAGCGTLESVVKATRAGAGCGSCKPLVREILAADLGEVAEDPAAHYYVPAVPLAKAELVERVRALGLRSVSAVLAALGAGDADAKSKTGLASLLRTIWNDGYEDERDARFINDRVHANIQNDRTFSVVPRIYGGVTTADELRRIADAADRYGARMIKLTGGQRIDLLGIRKDDLPHIWRDLGMPSGHAYTKAVRTVKTCVGTEFCRFGVGDAIGLGIAIERRFQGIETPHKVKMAASGCPRNCAEATTKDIGLVAIEGGRWEVLVGGAAGASVRAGDRLVTVASHGEALRHVGRFLQYYREHAKYLERTYGFVERVGIERLRAVLVDDVDGLCAGLDDRMERTVAAYEDPWAADAALPKTAGQFISVEEVHIS